MGISAQGLERLGRLGYTSEDHLRFWRHLWQSEGESFFWGFLQSEEQAGEEYRRWMPRLVAYAAECRRAVPVPETAGFSAMEREQHRVLLEKMREFLASEDRKCILHRKPNQAAILSTSRIGLAAAFEVFGQSGAIILEQSERERWLTEICPVDYEGFWWYAFAWWTIRDELTAEDAAVIRDGYPLPEGCSHWIVESGVQWGTLAGGATHELWRWDGNRAEFVGVYCVDTY